MEYYRAPDKKYVARWRVYENGNCIGYLDVWLHSLVPPMIAEISVRPSSRRQGIATALLRLAKERFPDLRHSPDRTEMGELWARSTGDELPEDNGLWPPVPDETDLSWDEIYYSTYYVVPSALTRLV